MVQIIKSVRKWLRPIADPFLIIKGVLGYWQYFADWKKYSSLPNAEEIKVADAYPQVHDRTANTPFDAHYFYTNGWAMRRIVDSQPAFHMDIGSQLIFADLLSAVIPVIFLDYRPLLAKVSNLQVLGGSILELPFADQSVVSLSCLHVIEHIGLGRYGDPLDPDGTRKAFHQLSRVLAPGGNLFISTPVGKPKLAFNAHRIHAPDAICAMLPELRLIEFSGVHDNKKYIEYATLSEFRDDEYACGFYWFRK